MKVRTLVFYIIFITLIFFIQSMTVKATEYKKVNTEVNAENILIHMEKGDEINLMNCSIVGELNVNKIRYSETMFNEAIHEIGYNGNLRVIKSPITIEKSTFKNKVNFSNVQFK